MGYDGNLNTQHTKKPTVLLLLLYSVRTYLAWSLFTCETQKGTF